MSCGRNWGRSRQRTGVRPAEFVFMDASYGNAM